MCRCGRGPNPSSLWWWQTSALRQFPGYPAELLRFEGTWTLFQSGTSALWKDADNANHAALCLTRTNKHNTPFSIFVNGFRLSPAGWVIYTCSGSPSSQQCHAHCSTPARPECICTVCLTDGNKNSPVSGGIPELWSSLSRSGRTLRMPGGEGKDTERPSADSYPKWHKAVSCLLCWIVCARTAASDSIIALLLAHRPISWILKHCGIQKRWDCIRLIICDWLLVCACCFKNHQRQATPYKYKFYLTS